MTTEITGSSSRSDITSIDDTDSPYTTQGEGTISVDTSSGAVTVTLASADVKSGQPIEIYDSGNNASSNNITINTEGSESINPGGASSITLDTDGTYREIKSDGSDWFAQVNAQRDVLNTEQLDVASASPLYQSGSSINSTSGTVTEDVGDWTNTTYDEIAKMAGGVDPTRIPSGASLYGRILARIGNSNSGDSTSIRPVMWDGLDRQLTELEITVTGSPSNVDSGYVEITSLSDDNPAVLKELEGKVSGGTGSMSVQRNVVVMFEWRLD